MSSQEIPRLYAAACEGFTARVCAIGGDMWRADTPCAGWTVLDVVDHVVCEQRAVPELLAGGQATGEPGGRGAYAWASAGSSQASSGEEANAAWTAAAADALAAWRAEGALRGMVALRRGPTPAWRYAEELLVDLAVHTWDVARAAGLDERLDDELVTRTLAHVRVSDHYTVPSPLFGPARLEASADPQRQLLALLGRAP